LAALVAIAVLAAAATFLALWRWDVWFVNYDGTFYLALAHQLRAGAGYVFPDGSPAVFRGPGYAGLIAAAWSVLPETARTAIWASRGVFPLAAALTALLSWRLTRSVWAAAAAGVLVAVQPAMLISGAMFFAPDGLMVAVVLGALLVLWWRPETVPGAWRLVAVGLLLGLAFLVKELAILGLLLPAAWLLGRGEGVRWAGRAMATVALGWLIPVAAWAVFTWLVGGDLSHLSGLGAPLLLLSGALLAAVAAAVGRWGPRDVALPRWVLVIGVFGVGLAALLVVRGGTINGAGGLWSALGADLQRQLYRDSWWWPAIPGLIVLVIWAGARLSTRAGAYAGALVAALGLASLVYAILVGAGLRNGLLLVYGLALLTGGVVADVIRWRPARLPITGVAVLLVAALASSVSAAAATNGRLPVDLLTAEGPASRQAAAWLQAHASQARVAGTSLYFQSIWRLAGGAFEPARVPWYVTPLGAPPHDANDLLGWAGTTKAPRKPDAVSPIGVIVTRTTQGVVFDDIAAVLDQVDYVAVTGNRAFPSSAFDGGILLPWLDASPAAEPVFVAVPEHAQWVVVFRLSHPFRWGDGHPLIHLATDAPAPSLGDDAVVVDRAGYANIVDTLLHDLGS